MTTWASFPLDILISIFRLLPAAAAVRCTAVCSSWLSAVRLTLHPSVTRPPSLMLPSANHPTAANFFSLTDGSLHTIHLPDPPIGDRIWIGSSAGWLVTAGLDSELLLVNPLTRAQLPLPSVATLPHVASVYDPHGRLTGYRYSDKVLPPDAIRSRLFNKAVVVVAAPDLTVMLLLASSPHLAFARAGDASWTPLETSAPVHDAVVHKGKVYSVNAEGMVEVWGVDRNPSACFAVAIITGLNLRGGFVDKYLVEYSPPLSSSEKKKKLLQVWRMTAGRFRVFEMERNGWVELRGLGDWSLFLGNNGCMAVSASEFPGLRGNCIYFTENYGVFRAAGCGNWVYSLEDGSTKACYPLHDSGLDGPLPIWIMLCMS